MHAIYRNKIAYANCRQVAKNQTDKLGLHATGHREVHRGMLSKISNLEFQFWLVFRSNMKVKKCQFWP